MLKDFLPPHICRIESQPAYFDPVRKKYVLVTPRETIRQRVIPFLIQELEVPQKMICIGELLLKSSQTAGSTCNFLII